MKSLLSCALLALLLLTHHATAQTRTTPPPFPGWANKGTPTPGGVRPAADARDIVGVWEGFLTDGDGSNPGQRRMNITLNITADHISTSGGGHDGEGTYRISAGTGALRQIDGTGTAGQYAGKHYEGIFLLEGNTLKWCSGNPGKSRPTELRTNTGAGQFLMVLTRKP